MLSIHEVLMKTEDLIDVGLSFNAIKHINLIIIGSSDKPIYTGTLPICDK